MSERRIRLARPHLGREELDGVAAVLDSGFLVQGRNVAAFEEAVAERVGVPHAVACSSGTAALHLALAACALGPDDRVLVPDYTFPATANVAMLEGHPPTLVDIDPATFNIEPDSLRRCLAATPRAKVLIPVHGFGLPADPVVIEIAREAGLTIIEDAACALGATVELDGATRQAGSFGDIGCFSFHPRKVITTGEGGLCTTHDGDLAARLRRLRNHGMERGPDGLRFLHAGFNYRLTDMGGAIGRVQMQRLDDIIADRRRIADAYDVALQAAGLVERGVALPSRPPYAAHIFQSYVLMLPDDLDRDGIIAGLSAAGIESTIGTHSLHAHPAYRDLPRDPAGLPGSAAAWTRSLSLPVPWQLSTNDIDRVATTLASLCGCA